MAHDVGGQAIIEGVMIKTPTNYTISVRKPKGNIKTIKKKYKSITERKPFLKKPFIRGLFVLFENLFIGVKALTISANESMDEETEQFSVWELILTISIAVAATILLFVVLPFFIAKLFASNGVLFNAIDSVVRVLVFIVYILAITMLQDVRRLFMYHGAEHKAINCYEHNLPLTLANTKKFTTVHQRCGTSFLLLFVILSIIIYSLILTEAWYWNLLSRILLLPVIAGVAYEFLKFSARNKSKIIYYISMPGLWLQKLTTRQPTDDQVIVALTALKTAIKK
ncbi:DUF1385 domain-containing protein [Candidatus Woesearchaeota archaeon]|nr:DUF1385 domain-containing protein [Candidatus Woesearchaeota archaeon]